MSDVRHLRETYEPPAIERRESVGEPLVGLANSGPPPS
jgi:hypothetical protein